jgi:hypothetical protein
MAYILVIIIWLVLMSLPIFSILLATRIQLQVGSTEGEHIRIFLVQENDAEGIGLELKRSDSFDPACAQTSVRYIMWKGNPENVIFCQCIDPDTGNVLSAVPEACSIK